MRQGSPFATTLYWVMILTGAGVLAPCLILPAWFEYRAALELERLWQARVARHTQRVEALRAQQAAFETDDAYVLRLAREHLNIETPGVRRIEISRPQRGERGAAAIAPPAPPEPEALPRLTALLDRAVAERRLLQVFVRPETRPSLMVVGAGMIVAAVLLLGRNGGFRDQRSEPVKTS